MQENLEEQWDHHSYTHDIILDIRWSSNLEKDKTSSTVLQEYQSIKSNNSAPVVHLPPSQTAASPPFPWLSRVLI
jgi:hypothetical protein